MDREKIIAAMEWCRENPCDGCPYEQEKDAEGRCTISDDTISLLKEQEKREKRICKEICDFIHGSCSTDTDSDKEYVCQVIQQMFIKGRW